jgi:hypothetical protein
VCLWSLFMLLARPVCQSKVLPTKSILIGDGGDFVATASYIVRPRGPLTWLDPGAFGTLGACGRPVLTVVTEHVSGVTVTAA